MDRTPNRDHLLEAVEQYFTVLLFVLLSLQFWKKIASFGLGMVRT